MNENARDGKLWIGVKDIQPEQDGRHLVTMFGCTYRRDAEKQKEKQSGAKMDGGKE